jgi:hypothetical protein
VLETVEQRNALLASIERARGSSVIAYILHDNAVIADDAIPHLHDKLQAIGRRERIDLLLYARGGAPEVCWRVLNLLRQHCDHLGLIVGHRVQGAASILALGADEIVIGPLSELGGIEAARRHPLMPRDELGQPVPLSFGELKAALEFLAQYGGEAGEGQEQEGRHRGLLAAFLQQIHPIVIGHLHQADRLARQVTRKALLMHMHPEDREKIERIVDLFNGGFHSPLYTVTATELAGMGLHVAEADHDMWAHIWNLVQLYQSALYTDRPDQTQPGAFFRYLCLIESVGRLTGLRQSFTQVEGQERVLNIRWETAIRAGGPGPSFGPGGMSNN